MSTIGMNEIVLDDLNPTCTYEIRTFAIHEDSTISESSPVIAVDTEVPGCGSSKPCCIV